MIRRPVIHQFTAVLAGRDAVGAHTAAVDELLREMGCETTIFSAHTRADAGIRAHHFRDHGLHPRPDLIIYQMSTGSPVSDYLLTRPEPLVLDYHNITPASSFELWDPQIAAELARARQQLVRLVRRARSAIADSCYNAAELRALGLDDVAVAPVIWREPRRVGGSRPTDQSSPVVLFVGRIAPNKRHEDLIGALAILRARRPGARLVLVGAASSPRYEAAVRELSTRLGLGRAVEFAGSVPARALDACYARSTVYMSASDHEGFCVPILEAMSAGVLVVARAAAAVPETVGNAGLLVDAEGPYALVAAADRVVADERLRDELVERGRRRARALSAAAARRRMREVLEPLLDAL